MRIDVLGTGRGVLPRWRHDGMARPYWRLYRNAAPGWSVVWRGAAIPMDPDRILLIAPETTYAGRGPGACDHLWVHAVGDGLLADAPPGVHVLPAAQPLAGLLDRTAAAVGVASSVLAAAAVLAAVAGIAALPARRPGPAPALAAAMELGRRHAHRRIGNHELAHAAAMHRASFIRRFHDEIGLTPQAWHLRLRITAACIALERGDPIEAVAAAHGFCDRHHFTRVFTRLRGCSPGSYRRRRLHAQPQEASLG